MSKIIATTITTKAIVALWRDGIRAESSKPNPKPKRLCIATCAVKQDFIFAFI